MLNIFYFIYAKFAFFIEKKITRVIQIFDKFGIMLYKNKILPWIFGYIDVINSIKKIIDVLI